jgi:chitodextrinase
LALSIGVISIAFISGTARAQASAWNSVRVTWTSTGDDSLTGTASQHDLRYSTSPITTANFNSATRVTGVPAPMPPGSAQSFTVLGLSPSTAYWFAIKTGDEVPNWSAISNVITRTTAAAPDVVRPAAANITITTVGDTSVTIAWTAVGDDSLSGNATTYDVRFSTAPITAANWGSATAATGEPAPAAPGAAQSMQVRGLARQTTYYFALRTQDEAGNLSALSNVPNATTLDSLRPASVRDLAASFVWVSWHSTSAVVTRNGERAGR